MRFNSVTHELNVEAPRFHNYVGTMHYIIIINLLYMLGVQGREHGPNIINLADRQIKRTIDPPRSYVRKIKYNTYPKS